MKAFDEYTKQFDMNNNITRLKYNHSYRVSKLSNLIAEKLNLSDEDIKLATMIGLIHDIGRFEQIKKYDTLSDIGTMDHADFGSYLLFDKNLIAMFNNNVYDYEIIKKSVSNHNKYSISNNYSDRELEHIKIIRDADKIDILNIWANLDELVIKSDGDISNDVKTEFYEHNMIHNELKNTEADKVIGTLSYLYDINYLESYEYIIEENFIWNLYNRLNDKEKFIEYFQYIDNYICEKRTSKDGKKYVRKKI